MNNVYISPSVLSQMPAEENTHIKYQLARVRYIFSDLAARHTPYSAKALALSDLSKIMQEVIEELEEETTRRQMLEYERIARENAAPQDRG